MPDYKIIQETLIPILGSWVDAVHYVIVFAFLAAAPILLVAFRKSDRGRSVARRVIQALSFLVFVIIIHRCLCGVRGAIMGAAQVGRDDITAFGSLCVVIPILAFTLIFGRIFCGWVCPLGFFLETLAWIRRGVNRLVPRAASKGAGILLWFVFIVLTALVFWKMLPSGFALAESAAAVWGVATLGLTLYVLLEPSLDKKFRTLRSFAVMAWILIILAGVFVTAPWCVAMGGETDYSSITSLVAVSLAGLIIPMSWCRYACPLGGAQSWLAKSPLVRPLQSSGCRDCGQCRATCPWGALEKGKISAGECLVCGACFSSCGFRYGTERKISAPGREKLWKAAGAAALAVALSAYGFSTGAFSAPRAVGAGALKPVLARTRLDPPIGQWWSFARTFSREVDAPVRFDGAPRSVLWKVRPFEHVWSYQRRVSVWSDSPVIASVDSKTLIIAGYYDRNLYAFDAATGKIAWRFTLGGYPVHSPAFAQLDGRAMVFATCTDRMLYALDAASGHKLWSFEALVWSESLEPAVASAPVVTWVRDRPAVVFSMWISDRSASRDYRKGELIALGAASGELLWRQTLSTTPLSSPTVTGSGLLAVAAQDGRIFGVAAETGQTVWEYTTEDAILGAPGSCLIRGVPAALVGNRFGKVYCMNAADGKILWTFKTGHSVESTPVFCPQPKGGLILVGSQDRSLYALESETGAERWSLKTGDYISATAALAMDADRWIACIASLDNFLYFVNASDGRVLAKIPTGEFIWSHYTRYDSHWSSPAIGLDARGKPMVVFGSYDGFLYRIGSTTEAQHSEAQARAKSEDIK